MKEKVVSKITAVKEKAGLNKPEASASLDFFGRAMVFMLMLGAMGFATVSLGAAYNIEIFSFLENGSNAIKADIIEYSSVAAGLCASICILLIMFSKNEKAVGGSWNWLKRIGICYVGILFLPNIITAIKDFATTNGADAN